MKAFNYKLQYITETITVNLIMQFGFIGDPQKILLPNTSEALATTPTCYYFSHYPILHSTTSLTKNWAKIHPNAKTHQLVEKPNTNKPGKALLSHQPMIPLHWCHPTSSGTYDSKLYVCSNWTQPHWMQQPEVMEK